MDPLEKLNEEDRWKSTILDEVFKALASSPELSKLLVYKGARVLRLRLGEMLRASFDIDASLSNFAANADKPANDESLLTIKDLAHRAIAGFFESQEPVRYDLLKSEIRNRRKTGSHPRGWDVYWLDIQVRDLAAEGLLSTIGQNLRIDIAAPELFSEKSFSPLDLDGFTVTAVSLERIAGEKLRAFLSCLPTYRKKIEEKTQVDRRVKDLYDLVRINRKRPIENSAFWSTSAEEFLLACRSRFIDCEGLTSFREEWDETKKAYAADKTLPTDVTIDEAEMVIAGIAEFLRDHRFVPFSIQLPEP